MEGTAEPTSPAEIYETRARRFDGEAEERSVAVRRYGWARLATFVGILVAMWGGTWGGWGSSGWVGAGVLAVLFAVLVRLHGKAKRRLLRVELMAEFNRDGQRRLARDWAELPEHPETTVDPHHGYARDLDIVGPASLLRLLGTPGTAPGWKTLLGWILDPAPTEDVEARQAAAVEVAEDLDYRDALAAEARLVDTGDSEAIEAFLKWAEGDPWLATKRWVFVPAWVLPIVNLTAIALYSADMVGVPVVTWSLLISGAVLSFVTKGIHKHFGLASVGESGVREYDEMLKLISEGTHESQLMVALRDRLDDGVGPAHAEIRHLRRWLDMADVRRSPLFHIPLALVLFWDVHVLRSLEKWQQRAGGHVRDWLRVLGETEALMALGALVHDHPDWSMPRVAEDVDRITGEAVGHPLIPPGDCVRNDVSLGPPGSFLLVTGSNMSGKSTLLRAIGLNVVLARCGGPVCADSLELPPLRVWTSMRVDDSLAGGVSFFMAELQRLKHVVDGAESASGPARALYLLDEILQGTNTAERRVAARTVIRRLLESGALGAVTTHDLTLADSEDLEEDSVPVHFTETVGSGEDEGLMFDYKLRSGIATSTNALKLLGLVGLSDSSSTGSTSPPAQVELDGSAPGSELDS